MTQLNCMIALGAFEMVSNKDKEQKTKNAKLKLVLVTV